MPYRIYTLGDDGHFIKVDEVDASDDASAIIRAKQMQNGLPLEIWDGCRIVKKLDRRFTPWRD